MNIRESMEEIRRQQIQALKQKTQMPGIIDMGKNLLNTAIDVAKGAVSGDGVALPEEQANTRLEICKSCEFYVSERCTQCGCFMAVKTYLKAANCPVGKW